MPVNLNKRTVKIRMLTLILGVLGSTAGLYLAAYVVGPIVRSVFGAPRGFNEDYATKEAWLQARLVEVLTVSAVFLALGALLKFLGNQKPFGLAAWTSNPISIGLGYWLFQKLWSGDGPGEYFGLAGMVLFALIGPLLFVPSFLFGGRINNLSSIGKRGET